MLMPKRVKHRKQFRGTISSTESRGTEVNFGEFGLQATTAGWVSSQQIESARRAITHSIKRGGRVWIRIFPDKPVSKKPPEVRMGGGKGDLQKYVAVVKPGRMLFEMSGVSSEIAQEALRLAAHKLPVKTRFVAR